MFVRAKKRGNRTCLMIVKNERVNGKLKQTVLHSLGVSICCGKAASWMPC